MRGGGNNRGRGTGTYQAPRGGQQNGGGRGRGGPPQQRGGMNAGAPSFSPGAGQKRQRDEGSFGHQQGNAGKRPRGGM